MGTSCSMLYHGPSVAVRCCMQPKATPASVYSNRLCTSPARPQHVPRTLVLIRRGRAWKLRHRKGFGGQLNDCIKVTQQSRSSCIGIEDEAAGCEYKRLVSSHHLASVSPGKISFASKSVVHSLTHTTTIFLVHNPSYSKQTSR